ncbi:hypothetical protein OH492_13485 [Vibrio chagasii]|nr:hypothetical protein [Vibrio chagasii]
MVSNHRIGFEHVLLPVCAVVGGLRLLVAVDRSRTTCHAISDAPMRQSLLSLKAEWRITMPSIA